MRVEFTFKVNEQTAQLILGGLGKLPLEQSIEAFFLLKSQYENQKMQPSQSPKPAEQGG
jgi:hypothetical protein